MERRTTGSWVQCANRFGEISLRLSPHAGGERTAQRIGQHKYIGGAYKILGRLGEATLAFPGPPSLRVRERILAPEKRERGHRGGARRPPPGGYQRLNLVQFSSIRFGFRWKQALRSAALGRPLRFPFEMTALLPVAEVGFVDGLGGEMGGEDGPAQLAVLEAQVELLAEGQREAGDFAVASHRGLGERSIVSMRAHENKNASRWETYRRFLNDSLAGSTAILAPTALADGHPSEGSSELRARRRQQHLLTNIMLTTRINRPS